jgi:dihydrofolate reductase
MRVSIMVAMDRTGLIGNDQGLPWHLPADLKRFRALTWEKPVIMGRKTFQLIGRPLPRRYNIVLSHDTASRAVGCQMAESVDQALALAEQYLASTGGEEIMVIGGSTVYAEFFGLCERVYLTVVDGRFQGSSYFPKRELSLGSWRLVQEQWFPADDKNSYPHRFYILERQPADAALPCANNRTAGPFSMQQLLDAISF